MKIVYATYKQNGILKKATLNEEKYSELKQNTNVSDLTMYASELLMEQNYSSLTGKGNDSKKILHG